MTGDGPAHAAHEGLEWLEADGHGGFASGTASGIRTRRYHALLLAATTPPTGRLVLVSGLDAELRTAERSFALSSQRFADGTVHPDGVRRLAAFRHEPWPRWTYALEDGSEIEHELFVPRGAAAVVLRWRRTRGDGPALLRVRPYLAARDYHGLQRENGAFRFAAEPEPPDRVVFRPYHGVPAIVAAASGAFRPAPDWWRRFHYAAEAARGLDAEEDLAAPGVFELDLAGGDAVLVLAAEGSARSVLPRGASAREAAAALREDEAARRAAFPTPLARAADAYVVSGRRGATIVAGYPWFTDWGRDTFIALRGLLLATGRLGDAHAVLESWADAVSDGMLPNRFPDAGDAPEYNAVDASLWYVVAVHELRTAAEATGRPLPALARRRLEGALQAILEGYEKGTRHGIRCDDDGLLAAGEPGVQLTWMDAKVGDWVVTPRCGKPVEVQALWWNALRIGGALDPRWDALARRCETAFHERFWNEARGCLFDVVDVDRRPGSNDAALRPNQIFAAGGLPFALLGGERARRVVDLVEERLWTPLGLRSLAPGEPGFAPRYAGGVRERDGAYHQGTVWPWLAGAFVDAWLRVRGDGPAARAEARRRFLAPLRRHLADAGLGHVSEIADAEAPHAPNGCPFQAWSVGELLRLERRLADGSDTPA